MKGTMGHLKLLGGRARGAFISTTVQAAAPPIKIKGMKNRKPFTHFLEIERPATKMQAEKRRMKRGTLTGSTSGLVVLSTITPAQTNVKT